MIALGRARAGEGGQGRRGLRAAAPTLLTLARIVLILPFALCILANTVAADRAALALFLLAAVTDWLDGALARAWNARSSLGRVLDPIADKMLVAACLLLLAARGAMGGAGLLAALTILLRELAVAALREWRAERGGIVAVSRGAKLKTAAQLVALGLLLAGLPDGRAAPASRVGEACLVLAAALSSATGLEYGRRAARPG